MIQAETFQFVDVFSAEWVSCEGGAFSPDVCAADVAPRGQAFYHW